MISNLTEVGIKTSVKDLGQSKIRLEATFRGYLRATADTSVVQNS